MPLHLFRCLDTHGLLQVLIGWLQQELPSDNSLLCFFPIHVPFCPPEDRVLGVSFVVKEEGSINFYCLRQAPLSPSGLTIAHPSTLGSPGIPLQAVVLPPLLSKKVGDLDYPGSAMSGDEMEAKDGCAKFWKLVCLYVSGSEQGPFLKRKAPSALVHKMWRNEIACNSSSPGCYSGLFIVRKTSGGLLSTSHSSTHSWKFPISRWRLQKAYGDLYLGKPW